MIKIFVYTADQQLAEQTVQSLKHAGAESVEVLGSFKIPARPPKENRYLFICETPAEKLSALAPKVLPEADYVQELGQWYEAQCQIVTTATAQKKRSIVVTSGQTCDANSLLTSLNDQWGLSLNVQDSSAPAPATKEPLLAYLVQNLIEQTPPLKELAIQINTLAGSEDAYIHETDALTGYRGLLQQHKELQTQNQNLTSAQEGLKTQLKNATEESELLLTQLHSVQEELESIFIEHNAFKEAAAKEKFDLSAALDAQAKATKEATEESELLLTQLHSVQEELESIFIEHNAFKEAAAKEKFDLSAALDAQAKATKEATEEGELLLLQLHQVQEELEHYFLKNQEAEAKLAKQQTRWQRLLEKYPDHIDTESIQVELIDPTAKSLKWVVKGLESQVISKDYLEFDSFIESGILGIRFNKTNSRNEPTLKNWPASCEGETIDCIPAGKGNVMRQRARTLRELSASDWKLLNTLPQLIKQHLNDTALDPKLCGAVNDAANKLTFGINALPKTFRYDAVKLRSSKVNPDYEHLWFDLYNASYDIYHWPSFEFRLGAANVNPGKFSEHPKLEIPLIDGNKKPFNSWFEESYDDYGGKYELRFDLKRGITDIKTLLRLDNRDRNVISALLASLPTIFNESSENIHIKVTRKAEDWFNLAMSVNRIANSVG